MMRRGMCAGRVGRLLGERHRRVRVFHLGKSGLYLGRRCGSTGTLSRCGHLESGRNGGSYNGRCQI